MRRRSAGALITLSADFSADDNGAARRRSTSMKTLASAILQRGLVMAALAAFVTIAPVTADAQWDQWRSTHDDGDRRLELNIRGKIWFTDDDSDIQRLEPGGRLMIEERKRFAPERMIIITAAENGDLQRTYLVDGQPRPYDDAAKAWLGTILPSIIRESGVGAVERVKRIFA